MREKNEVIGKAALLVRKLQGRAQRIVQLGTALAQRDAGIFTDVGPDRADTMRRELVVLGQRQASEGIELATLRWVLGVTEDIDPDNLELEQ